MSSAIHATKKYNLFDLSDFNRDISQKRVKQLMASFEKHGWIEAYPIHCVRGSDGRLKIKAGHHRFVAARALGIAVLYIVCDDEATLPELEKSNPAWSFIDYLKAYARVGSADHQAVLDYSERTGIGIGQSASLLAGECASSSNQSKRVKNGSYKLGPQDHANRVAYLVMSTKEIGVPFATHPLFVSAISCVSKIPEFNPQTFLQRLATMPSLATKQATRDGYLDLIETIYNRKTQKRTALAFLAKEAARERAIHLLNAKPKGK
jgi:hypothetical protein